MICSVVLLTDMKCSPLIDTIEEYIKFLLIVSYEFVHGVKKRQKLINGFFCFCKGNVET